MSTLLLLQYFTGADEVYKSTWFAFENLKFLLYKNIPRQTYNTVNIFLKNYIYIYFK